MGDTMKMTLSRGFCMSEVGEERELLESEFDSGVNLRRDELDDMDCMPPEALIIFDWDDTLFPTSFLREHVRGFPHCGSCASTPGLEAILEEYAQKLSMTLIKARELGEVAIVTASCSSWVMDSAKRFMPSLDLDALLADLNIQVYYAFDHVTKQQRNEAELEDGADILLFAKSRAMKKLVRRTYGQFKRRRLGPHVVSIGDATTEQTAIKEVLWSWDSKHDQESICKTVKLADDPDMAQMELQLGLLDTWLPRMLAFEGDFDFEMMEEGACLA